MDSKFCGHTLLHRQGVIYARDGVELNRTTLADWVGQAVFLLAPLAEVIGRHVRAGSVLHADDTTVPVLAPGLGKTKTGRLWVAVRDERPWGLAVPPAVFYRYARPRGNPCRSIARDLPWIAACRRLCRVRAAYRPATPGGEPPFIEVACWSCQRRDPAVDSAISSSLALAVCC